MLPKHLNQVLIGRNKDTQERWGDITSYIFECIPDISLKMAEFHRVLHCVRKGHNLVQNLLLGGSSFLTARSSFLGAHSLNFNPQRMDNFNFSLYFPFLANKYFISGKWKIYDAKALNSKYRSKTSEEFGKQLNAFRGKLKWKNLTKV